MAAGGTPATPARSSALPAACARAEAAAFLPEGTPELLLQRRPEDVQLLAMAGPGAGVDGPARAAALRFPLTDPPEARSPDPRLAAAPRGRSRSGGGGRRLGCSDGWRLR